MNQGDISAVDDRLDSGSKNTTVLAPLNTQITKLPRKPWENPDDYAALGVEAYHGENGQDRASRNLKMFVEAHIVPDSPWAEGTKVKTLGGNTVWWEHKDGKKLVSWVVRRLAIMYTGADDNHRSNRVPSRFRVCQRR